MGDEDQPEAGNDDEAEYVEALRLQLRDYQTVVSHQLEWAASIDQTAATLSRYIIALLALLATLIGVFPAQFPTNLAVVAGVAVILLSFVGSVITQTAADVQDGTQPRHGQELLEQRASERDWLEQLVHDYGGWIEDNETVIAGYATFLLGTQLLLIAGLCLLALGLAIGFV